MIFWCDKCNIPIIDSKICTLCGKKTRQISNDLRPVFSEEKKLISIILEQDTQDSSVWNKNSIYYIIDGKNVKVDYVEIFEKCSDLFEIRKQYMLESSNFEEILNANQNHYASRNKYLAMFIQANEQHIKLLEHDTQEYIKMLSNKCSNNIVPTVSFSGGKDSTVVSNLVRESYGKQEIFHLFGDTTLEFVTTYEYIDRFKKKNIFTPFINSRSEKNFFELCKEFGPPSRLDRWCCTIFKTAPISENINILGNNYNSLSFLGIRKAESMKRGNYSKTQFNSKISRQIVSMPILDWLNIDVWLYILYKKLDFNAAYNLGFTRVGCWCCPNNSVRSDFLMKLYFEDYYNYWHEILISYAKSAGIRDYDVYVNNGIWKSRRGLKGTNNKQVKLNQVDCNISDNSKIYFLNKKLSNNIIELYKPFGKIYKTFESTNLVLYKVISKQSTFKIHAMINSNSIKIEPLSVKDINLLYKRIECQIRKFEFCIGCMACDSVCSVGAINTVNGYKISDKKCIHCMKCIAKFSGGCIRTEKYKSNI